MKNSYKELTKLYRKLLRTSRQFAAYNFREHAQDRIKYQFRQSLQGVKEEQDLNSLTTHWSKELEGLKRQVLINNMFQTEKLIVENN